MRILIAGVDGYLGWSLARWLSRDPDVRVFGVDGLMRRAWVKECGADSIVPIPTLPARVDALEALTGTTMPFWIGDLREPAFASEVVAAVKPDVVVQFAECPSAPYSMIDADHSRYVQVNNLLTTFNLMFACLEDDLDAHFLKLGTLGEYGTPGIPIPEGSGWIAHRGRTAFLPFPRQAPSWYHWSKVHGSQNLSFASRLWGLRVTDVMQGVVYGVFPDPGGPPELRTRLDVDAVFGTVVHRWCAQAVAGIPLTIYGAGGQRRGFIPLQDSMRCLDLLIRNPPDAGEYRVVNQLDQVFRLCDLADIVQHVLHESGIESAIKHIENPRLENEDHLYEVVSDILPSLGFTSRNNLEGDLTNLVQIVKEHQQQVGELLPVLLPAIRWHDRPGMAN